MRSRIPALVLIASVAALAGCTRPPETPAQHARQEAEVRQFFADFTRAYSARDTNAVMALYAPGIVAYDLVPPLQYVGTTAYRKDFADGFAMYKGPIQLEIHDLHVEVSGDVAYGYALQHFHGTEVNGKVDDLWTRVTTGLRKIDGKWLDVHDHVSVPVDMATGKAALNLQP